MLGANPEDIMEGGGGCSVSQLVPKMSSAEAPAGVTHWAPLTSRELDHSKVQSLHAAVFYIQTCESTVHACHGKVSRLLQLSNCILPRPLEATFQHQPLMMWGPGLGQRGSNTGIVLRAQHAFSLWRDASERPLIF